MTDETGRNAVAFILKQHEQIRDLFAAVKGAADAEAKQQSFDALLRLLAVHETAEEEVVYPAVRRLVDGGDTLVEPRLREEDLAKKRLSELEKLGAQAPEFDAKLAEFETLVVTHAEAEERDVLPRLREAATPDKLDAMATALAIAEAVAPTHPHPHAPESAAGNMIVGPFVAIVDRVRDAVRNVGR
jgi:hemerythrin superfamily protein